MRKLPLFLTAALTGCGIYHAAPIGTATQPAPETADAAEASTNCFEAVTQAEKTVCATPGLAAPNRAMVQALQADLRDADMFARDAVLASQRVWLLGLDAACHGQNPADCLRRELPDRTRILAAWRAPGGPVIGRNAVAQYVTFHPQPGAADPTFCASFARRADAALASAGALDPAAMGGAEIAGTHGPATATDGGRRLTVDLHQANVFGLYQTRARGLRIDGVSAIDSLSLTNLVPEAAANKGGRFSAYASQTGDYASIDAFRAGNRNLVLVADTWGFDTPAAPGEFAHAGLWDIGGTVPAPLCLFDTYHVPPDTGTFADGTSFASWRAALARLRDSTQLPLGTAALRDESQLRADTDFRLLNMPLLAVQQARAGAWTPWLRKRHDAVLDALFTWSAAAPDNKLVFDAVFGGLHDAARNLVRTYQQTQGLTAEEAKDSAALAIMELLYSATVNIAPSLGADLGAPRDAAGYTPRYPILATPQA
jgi:uncharacterized protein YecT (DUF1311 family)